MKFVSLSDPTEIVSFEAALSRGMALNSSLYVPLSMPQLAPEDIKRLVGADRHEIARIMLTPWVGDEIPPDDLKLIIEEASTFETPVVQVGDKRVLEMFHGPTMAFKDVAASYLAAFMSYFNRKVGRHSMVLVATSGDTGGAIAHGFAGATNLDLVVLYPKGRISLLQREQLRRVAPNVSSLEVNGDFNDCQELVKQAFADKKLSEKLHLTSANSINIGRLIPQITYYASLYGQIASKDLRVIVPTGNLGNLTAGLLARAMGVPLKSFVAATNMNDSLVRFLESGNFESKPTVRTMSNAMDVSAPNNLPRFKWVLDDDLETMRSVVQAVRVTDNETVRTIKQVHESTGYLLDPHTAVGWCAAETAAGKGRDVIVSTASPLKFAEEIFEKTGIKVDNSRELATLRRKPERYQEIDNSFEELAEFLNGLRSRA